MQVEVTEKGLERRLKVEVPAEQVEEEVRSRLQALARQVRIDGFRPGKVPLKVVERRYGSSVRREVRDALIQSTFTRALAEHRLRPAGGASFELEGELAPGAALRYTAVFEVYPEFEARLPEGAEVERPQAAVTEEDVERMIQKLRRQRAEWVAVDREAGEGDRVVIDFRGTVDGQPFPGNEGKDYVVELGGGTVVKGFDRALLGARAGESRSFDVDFPEDYRVPQLAGKRVHFDVQVKEVREARLPELDEAFFQAFGVQEGGLEALRREVRASMERELEQAVRERVKRAVMDALLAANPDVELPRSLVSREVEVLKRQLGAGPAPGTEEEAQRRWEGRLEAQARRRVALGLIVAELVRRLALQADPAQVRARVEAIAASYEQPEEVIRWYYSDRERLVEVETSLLEDQVVEKALEVARISERPMSFDELMGAGG